jgi:mannan endo-1,4-beta-mannosidase
LNGIYLITIDTHFPNPVSPDGGDLKNRSNLTFTDLLKSETETGQRWRSYLDIVAEGLDDLQKANVTVLYRPFHEMNGGWEMIKLNKPSALGEVGPHTINGTFDLFYK